MKYAVIKTGGKQYKVSQGDTIEVDKLALEKDGKVIFDEVLLMVDDEKVKIGKPFLTDKVEGKILEHFKGDKVRVAKFKAKARYRKVNGFRASLTKVKIEKFGSLKTEKPKKVTPKKSK